MKIIILAMMMMMMIKQKKTPRGPSATSGAQRRELQIPERPRQTSQRSPQVGIKKRHQTKGLAQLVQKSATSAMRRHLIKGLAHLVQEGASCARSKSDVLNMEKAQPVRAKSERRRKCSIEMKLIQSKAHLVRTQLEIVAFLPNIPEKSWESPKICEKKCKRSTGLTKIA